MSRCSIVTSPPLRLLHTLPGSLPMLAIALALLVTHTSAALCTSGCTIYATCNEEVGRCDCPRNRTGPACQQLLSRQALAERCVQLGTANVDKCDSEANTCVNNCNGHSRGACVAGFCHCKPGFFGNDCALSMRDGPGGAAPAVLSDRGYAPRAAGPRVYIYDLPPELTTWRSDINLDRWTIRHFLEMLTASGARVADGGTADWFFIPVRLRSSSDAYVLQRAIHYLRQAHPWFNATGGKRHFVMAVGDMGRLESERGPLSANVTFVTHWGLSASKAERLGSSPWRASHRNATDIVLPVYISLRKLEKYGITRSRHHPKFAEMAPPDIRERNGPLFWFAGRICQDKSKPRTDGVWPNCPGGMGYSAMTRQAVHFHHWDRPGYMVAPGDRNYSRHLLTSKFCFGAMGGGHGQRQFQAALAGCVPVVIGDGVLEAWEPYLDWNQFGVRVAEADIPRLHEILAAIGPEEYARKVRSLRCAAQHMAFSGVTGAYMGESGRFDAFETLLAVLAARARHPDTPPERLRQVDRQLDAFMDCRSGAEEGGEEGGNGIGIGAAGREGARGTAAGRWREMKRPAGARPATGGEQARASLQQAVQQRRAPAGTSNPDPAATRRSSHRALLGAATREASSEHGPLGQARHTSSPQGKRARQHGGKLVKHHQRSPRAAAPEVGSIAGLQNASGVALRPPGRVCSVSSFDVDDPAAFPCCSLIKGIYSPPPGGLICAAVGDVSSCPRSWP